MAKAMLFFYMIVFRHEYSLPPPTQKFSGKGVGKPTFSKGVFPQYLHYSSNLRQSRFFYTHFAAHHIHVTATETVKQIVEQLHHKHVGVHFAYLAVVHMHAVAPFVYAQGHVVTEHFAHLHSHFVGRCWLFHSLDCCQISHYVYVFCRQNGLRATKKRQTP